MTLHSVNTISYSWMALAFIIHILLHFVAAPFGRHTSEKWGWSVNNKLGWFIMELPSLAIMCYFLLLGRHSTESFVWILFIFWIIHYINRTFIYPLRIKPTSKKMPLLIVINAIFFNVVNAGLNGYYLSEYGQSYYTSAWLTSPSFIIGALLFIAGMLINLKSDHTLINLRKPGEDGYKIPKGFLFDYISSPNLLGEIIEWTGFAVMAWNLPALSFMVWTFANLVPRAKNHHDWYHRHFNDYPKERKVVIPFIY